jgi:tetratricopeptide (TPR) repeat protein
MNPKFFRILLVWFALLAGGRADDLEQANRRFQAGDFAAAATTYQNLIDSSGPSAALLYNLANSQYRMGDYGPAILSYERAKLLAPRDPDLRVNLSLARKAAAVFDQSRYGPRVGAVISYLSRNEWSWLVVVCTLWLGVLAVISGAGWVSSPVVRKCAVGSLVMAGILISLGTTALILRGDEGSRGIVLSKDAGVLLSPFEKAESLGTPEAGRIVRMGEKSGVYFHVQVPDTELEGWMPAAEVARIAPRE